MIKLSHSISKYLKNNQSDFLLFGTIQNEWGEIVGEKIAKATTIIKIEKNKLYIKCKNPTWKQEMQFQKKEILKNIKEHTKNIKDLIII